MCVYIKLHVHVAVHNRLAIGCLEISIKYCDKETQNNMVNFQTSKDSGILRTGQFLFSVKLKGVVYLENHTWERLLT